MSGAIPLILIMAWKGTTLPLRLPLHTGEKSCVRCCLCAAIVNHR